MAYVYKIQQKDDMFELELKGDLSIENIDEIKKTMMDFYNSGNVLEITNSKIEKVDLTFLQLLVSTKKTAENEGKQLVIKDDFVPDVNEIVEISGLREYIF